MSEQTTEGGVEIPKGVVAEAVPMPEEEVSREPSDYVVLVGIDHEDGGLWWKELDGTVSGRTKRAAFNAAVAKFDLQPETVGDEAMIHLVPARSWKRITLRLEQPRPAVSIDGL